MKFMCICGESIHDITDYQENKSYFIPDQSWERMLEEIDLGLSPWEATRRHQRHMYQCYKCARIHIEDQNGNLVSFQPDEEQKFGILKQK